MPICPACNKMYDAQSSIEKAAESVLPDNLELYDFGGGMLVCPVPDFGNGVTLISHMAALIEKPISREGYGGREPKALSFLIKEGKWQKSVGAVEFDDNIAKDLKRAVAAWDTEAAPFSEGMKKFV